MSVKKGTLLLSPEEALVVRRGLRAILLTHGELCRCVPCAVGKPLLQRIGDKLLTPTPRAAVDQGETRP